MIIKSAQLIVTKGIYMRSGLELRIKRHAGASSRRFLEPCLGPPRAEATAANSTMGQSLPLAQPVNSYLAEGLQSATWIGFTIPFLEQSVQNGRRNIAPFLVPEPLESGQNAFPLVLQEWEVEI